MRVTILVGVSGSGKSTWAAEQEGATVVSADDYFVGTDAVYLFYAAGLPAAHRQCMSRFLDEMMWGADSGRVIVDNTNTSAAEVAPYIAVAQALDIAVEVLVFGATLSNDEAAARNVHGVPRAAIVRQRERLQQLRWNWPSYWPAWRDA